MKKYVIAAIFGCATLLAEMPEPYKSLKEVLPYDGHGWYTNGYKLEPICKRHNVRAIVEVGCWLGQSTRHFANLVGDKGKVIAIDHWKGSSENQPGASSWHPALPKLYEQFLSNVIHAHLEHIIMPMRMASLDAAKSDLFTTKKVVPDLIYIDASHEEDAVYADLQAWYPHVQGHGILCGDDWMAEGVRKAVQRFASEKKLDILAEYNFWRLVE